MYHLGSVLPLHHKFTRPALRMAKLSRKVMLQLAIEQYNQDKNKPTILQVPPVSVFANTTGSIAAGVLIDSPTQQARAGTSKGTPIPKCARVRKNSRNAQVRGNQR